MVDIHSHILPGVDDGSDSFAESVEMARLAVSGGTTEMLVTPHCNIPELYSNYSGGYITKRFEMLKKEVEDAEIPLKLFLGAEVYITDDIIRLYRRNMLNTVNGGKYMLVEFGFGEEPEYMDYMLDSLLDEDVIPVVAHPERYYASFDYPEMIYGWVMKGCGIQVNKGSIMGKFGEKPEAVARVLMGHNLVHCVASDAHTSWHRTNYLRDVYDFICDMYDEDYARLLLETNPHNVIFGGGLSLNDEPVFPDVDLRNWF
ncbi:MAG: hypothetical protein IJM37_09580 [Lachnospiraceae bacterium]|nr:hypothetical protein [Lachnospiraceae bacterium]